MDDADAPGGHPLPPGQRVVGSWQPSHYGRVPRIDPERWTFSVGGATRDGGHMVLDLEALDRLPRVEVDGGMHCVARTSVVGLRWGGVPLRRVVELMPPEDGAQHVLLAAVRGYAASVHLEDVLHPDALLATHVDGEPLTPEHGWPARVVLPHLYGFKGPKWVVEMTYHHQEQQGWWESRGYHPRARVDREERWAHQG
ncbi:molybdopterin-dependent oxidoreductase [Ornithinimicrobium flavum]|uniref:molybdopterin-dependent oxidoreductase n=1 Tax=Ornithinimicrobium flavum TaxID=1288636 RepID=UPI0010702B6A|nr:molybdopterin-dependent oxidoreductase [Ornithinimicrobium flavum]